MNGLCQPPPKGLTPECLSHFSHSRRLHARATGRNRVAPTTAPVRAWHLSPAAGAVFPVGHLLVVECEFPRSRETSGLVAAPAAARRPGPDAEQPDDAQSPLTDAPAASCPWGHAHSRRH